MHVADITNRSHAFFPQSAEWHLNPEYSSSGSHYQWTGIVKPESPLCHDSDFRDKGIEAQRGKITHSRVTQQADVDAKPPDVQKHRDVHLVWLFLFSSD